MHPRTPSRPRPESIVSVVRRSLPEHPVQGRTFSLYGRWESTEQYYRRIGILADTCTKRWGDPRSLLASIRRACPTSILASTRSRWILRRGDFTSLDPFLREILPLAREHLSDFTQATPAHLGGLSFRERRDPVLGTLRDEYHLLMLEIELTNRLMRQPFRDTASKLAFLPHCLRDHTRDCHSRVEGVDYVCRSCAKNCWVNGVSKILRFANVKPYIWMTADLPRLLARLKKQGESIGVLGIACVPELSRGMRLCARHRVPVVGVPLNANRCARWTGSFQPTSVNLDQIERFVGKQEHGNRSEDSELTLPSGGNDSVF